MQRVNPQQALCHANRPGEVALLFQQLNQPLQRFEIELLQAISLGQNPLIVASGQQVALVALNGYLQRLSLSSSVLGAASLPRARESLAVVHWPVAALKMSTTSLPYPPANIARSPTEVAASPPRAWESLPVDQRPVATL